MRKENSHVGEIWIHLRGNGIHPLFYPQTFLKGEQRCHLMYAFYNIQSATCTYIQYTVLVQVYDSFCTCLLHSEQRLSNIILCNKQKSKQECPGNRLGYRMTI